jgi:hypothetical protein
VAFIYRVYQLILLCPPPPVLLGQWIYWKNGFWLVKASLIGPYGDRFDHYERLRGHLSPPQPRRKPDRHPGMGEDRGNQEAFLASKNYD